MSDEATTRPPQLPRRLSPSDVASRGTSHCTEIARFGVRGSPFVVRVRGSSFVVRRSWFEVRGSRFEIQCAPNVERRTSNPEPFLTGEISAPRAHAEVPVAHFH